MFNIYSLNSLFYCLLFEAGELAYVGFSAFGFGQVRYDESCGQHLAALNQSLSGFVIMGTLTVYLLHCSSVYFENFENIQH